MRHATGPSSPTADFGRVLPDSRVPLAVGAAAQRCQNELYIGASPRH